MEDMVINENALFSEFYRNKRVLVTGHTGFKGSWLSIWLHKLGAEVIGYALDPKNPNDNYILADLSDKITDIRGDIRKSKELNEVFNKFQPEIVFHLAAQPLVNLSYMKPIDTYEVNLMGSLYVMEAARQCNSTKVIIMITTDKCYENKEQIWGYRENDPLGGYDPYSSSKGAAEIAIASWRQSFMNPKEYSKHKKSIASVRAGNVIGGGDWSLDRIVPDCIKAIEKGLPINIRNPYSTRPWQHVLEPLNGYMLLAMKLWENPAKYCNGWNFGPDTDSICTVWEFASKIVSQYGSGELNDTSHSKTFHETNFLSLDTTQAKIKLKWFPRMKIDKAVALTVDWYKRYPKENVYDICLEHIEKYYT